jgi:CRISPR-associated protein (TIGR03986 family)
MPRQINPAHPDQTAMAPYNFVPLPERVFTVEDGIEVNGQKIKPWEKHDRFVPGTHSGWIDLTITALTPLFIRGPIMRRADGTWDNRDTRLRPEPYCTPEGRPAIPGSSLRGMVRTLVEILAFAKIQPVSKAKPFFRDISRSRISAEYRRHFIDDLGQLHSGISIQDRRPVSTRAPGYRPRIRAGFVDATNRTIRECGLARVEQGLVHNKLGGRLSVGHGPMSTPNWELQDTTVWVQVDTTPQDYFFREKTSGSGRVIHRDMYLRFRKIHDLSQHERESYQKAVLVITGGIRNKHLEFAFLEAEAGEVVPIPDNTWDRFHSEDQITQWQERAFPIDYPMAKCRRVKGHLRDGEPVFFLTDDQGSLLFFGRAGMFRFPYDLSPADLVPQELRGAWLDLAEAMFGRVSEQGAIQGRIFVDDAVATSDEPENWFEETLGPSILSSPKVTTFQHYLTQDGTKGQDQLRTYLEADRHHTTIRGHKLYWHRWDEAQGLKQAMESRNHDALLADLDTQHTIIRPVKAGVGFSGRIRFENLTSLELGALLEALHLPHGCAHRLGMGSHRKMFEWS